MTAALIVAVTGCLGLGDVASADDGAGAYLPPSGAPTVVVVEGGGAPVEAGSGGGVSECWWEVQVPDDQAEPVYEVDGRRLYSATGRWLAKVCRGGEVVDQQPEGGLVDVEQLALEAARSVSIGGPALRTSPNADGLLYVHVPTWLWVTGSWWRDYSAMASTGRVSATVVASPVSVAWSTGDGATVTCDGPGKAWQSGMDDDASACQHTYRRATDPGEGRSLALSASVTFEVSWTSNIGLAGSLDPIERTSMVRVAVSEIQAIESE